MANVERDDEKDAKRVAESVLGVDLRHFDTDGGVDYLAEDSSVAVEVTRVTDGRKRAARSGITRSVKDTFQPPLASCWIVLASSAHRATKNLERRLRPMLAELEKAGISEFNRDDFNTYLQELPTHTALLRRVYDTEIESAGLPMQPDPNDHEHQILLSLTTDGSIRSSNESLAALLAELGSKSDNVKKLGDSGALHRVLFVWLDGDTPDEISRPLDGDPPKGLDQRFGIASVPPKLDPAITELWIVHEGTRRGWRWDGTNWSALEGV